MRTFFSAWLLLLAAARADVIPGVVLKPIDYGMFIEYGKIFNSQSLSGQTNPTPLDPTPQFTLNRSTGWFLQSATIDQRLDLRMGMAAVLFYLYPYDVGGYSVEQPYSEQLGGVALIQATGAYTWGDMKNPALKATFGYMQYKYNPDAQNLGEYLFRSTPYPSSTINSSWDLVGSARARMTGLVFTRNAFDGMWKNDVVVNISSSKPLYDISPAYVTSVKIPGTRNMLELGAGVNFYHLIQNEPSVDSPNPANFTSNGPNDYFDSAGTYYSANSSYYRLLAANIPGQATYYNQIASLVDAYNAGHRASGAGYSGYTAAGTMLMGRFSLDFKPILGDKMDLKFYGEASLLGVKDYPVFYNSMLHRVPVMLGLNIPTYGMLDLLNVEGEYWKNPYLNANTVIEDSYNTTGITPSTALQGVSTNDVKWSVTAKKTIYKALSVTGKVAKDHLTQLSIYDGLGSDQAGDILPNNGWYFILRLDVAI